ncbi:hypothetical protein TNCV_2865161 [Trichonephila clavipes]|nr:hypothetical protein TNCV_2865161 [Trichonephila clavipes]
MNFSLTSSYIAVLLTAVTNGTNNFAGLVKIKVVRVSRALRKRCHLTLTFHKKKTIAQNSSYRRINDAGPKVTGAPACNYSPTNRVSISKQGPRRNFDTGAPQSYLRQCVTYAE